jgi:hypothetical protein
MARKAIGARKAKAAGRKAPPRYRWDETGAATAYANSCSFSSGEGAIVARFGIDGRMTRSIVITPSMAKRLARLLRSVVDDHEREFGALPLAEN